MGPTREPSVAIALPTPGGSFAVCVTDPLSVIACDHKYTLCAMCSLELCMVLFDSVIMCEWPIDLATRLCVVVDRCMEFDPHPCLALIHCTCWHCMATSV
jgi:hypothetical protein